MLRIPFVYSDIFLSFNEVGKDSRENSELCKLHQDRHFSLYILNLFNLDFDYYGKKSVILSLIFVIATRMSFV